MKTTAGNDYQNLSVGAISINVYATQYTYEYDSNGKTYDEAAYYPYVVTSRNGEITNYTDFQVAMANIQEGDTITFYQSTNEALVYKTTEATTLKNITFNAAENVSIYGLQLISESSDTKLTLDTIKFEGIDFTDRVVLGQLDSDNGLSQCSNITFENCNFDLSASGLTEKVAIYHKVTTLGEATTEKVNNGYISNLKISDCTFKNMDNAINILHANNLDVEDCTFNDISGYVIEILDLIGNDCALRRNTADNIKGMLLINTVGNNYTTPNNATKIALIKNIITNISCERDEVFMTSYDNVNYDSTTNSSKSGYTWPTWTPFLNKIDNSSDNVGFKIVYTYGPSHQEFILQNSN